MCAVNKRRNRGRVLDNDIVLMAPVEAITREGKDLSPSTSPQEINEITKEVPDARVEKIVNGVARYAPTQPCPDCHLNLWWQRPDAGWVCGVCHEDPQALLARWRREKSG